MKKNQLAKSKADPSSKYWRNKADEAWSLVVRSYGKCIICGSTGNLQAHHLIDRSVKIFRHTLENGVCLCVSCHKYNRRLSAHKGSVAFSYWLLNNRSEQFAWVSENYTKPDVDKPDYKSAWEALSPLVPQNQEAAASPPVPSSPVEG